jgi:hypothetical protein
LDVGGNIMGNEEIKKDLRVSENLKELSNIVKTIIHKKTGFTVWQNKDDKKHVIPAVIVEQFFGINELALEFRTSDSSKIGSRSKLFMLNPESSVLIKGKVKILSKTRIKVIVDKKFYLSEKRINGRIDLSEKQMYAQIQRKIDLKDSHKEEQVRVKDISDGGFGFYITPSRAVLFQPDSKIVFDSIEGIEFETPLSGIIKHVTPVASHDASLSNTLLLVGVQFEQSFDCIDTVVQKIEVN